MFPDLPLCIAFVELFSKTAQAVYIAVGHTVVYGFPRPFIQKSVIKPVTVIHADKPAECSLLFGVALVKGMFVDLEVGDHVPAEAHLVINDLRHMQTLSVARLPGKKVNHIFPPFLPATAAQTQPEARSAS